MTLCGCRRRRSLYCSLLLLPLRSKHFPKKSVLEYHLCDKKARLQIFRISHLSCHCTLHCEKAFPKNKTLEMQTNTFTGLLSNIELYMIQSKYQGNKILITRVSSHYCDCHECSKRVAVCPDARVTKVLEYEK